ncbi:hypothetical protein AAIB46_36265 [Streptomyces sp. 35M1]|uniref:hypothetical protein n=1 Tax=Streptomyces sp. 35M1 TaxID=3142978 RepID=UPI003990816D
MPPGTTTLISAESTGIPVLPHWIPAPAAIAVLLITLALVTRWLWPRARKLGGGRRPSSAAVRVAAVAAIGCTAYSADTSWRFAADYLGMGSTVERASIFAVAELALFAMALMARQNLKGPRQAPGPPGVLVWVITGGQIIPAYAESGPVGGTVRALIGPVMAAVLWHLPWESSYATTPPRPPHAACPQSSADRHASDCWHAWASTTKTPMPHDSSANAP